MTEATRERTPTVTRPLALRRRPRAGSSRRGTLGGLTFLAPFLTVYAIFLVFPVAQAFYMSGYKWDLLGTTRQFVGWSNYERMLGGAGLTWSADHDLGLRLGVLLVVGALAYRRGREGSTRAGAVALALGGLALAAVLGIHPSATGSWNDPVFWIALHNTLMFALVSTPILMGVGLGLALALNGKRSAGRLYRTLFFLPYVLPISAVTLIWSLLLNPDRGLVAGFLHWFGVAPIGFLSDPDLAMPAIIATTVWWSLGFDLVLFVAGLQDINPSLYEAASIDGANAWQRFRNVTLPGLHHVTVLVTVTQVIASFQIFGQVYIMTRGGPGTATQVLVQHIYEAGFRNYQLGYAAAVSVFLFVVMAVVSGIQFRLFSKES